MLFNISNCIMFRYCSTLVLQWIESCTFIVICGFTDRAVMGRFSDARMDDCPRRTHIFSCSSKCSWRKKEMLRRS
jgi:hypothetical protein